jgi:hypothetical protein
VTNREHKADWTRRLPRPLAIPKVMTLRTLDDVRKLLRHLPADRRQLSTWQHVAVELDKAAVGADPINVAVALRLVLMLEHVPCRQQ